MNEEITKNIVCGNTVAGIEFGSTRIKAVLTGVDGKPYASGSFEWENRLENGYWTYHEEEIIAGLQACFAELKKNVLDLYDTEFITCRAMGISAMMHGYLALDHNGNLLTPFRTWRNNTTGTAAEALTEVFQVNIPQRWSVAHLYQAILNHEEHVGKIAYLTTLAGYVHWRLTGEKVIGIGDASGMFPINTISGDYDEKMVDQFDRMIAKRGYPWTIRAILPRVEKAGVNAGRLTEHGAQLLGMPGQCMGIPFCPPEGDAGTGMVATNCVREKTGNISAGTSIFAMVVMEHGLKNVHHEIDPVMTPDGQPVAMVHANNCTSDINSWAGLFDQFAESMGWKPDKKCIYETLYRKALEGDPDCGGLMSYGYISGEFITGVMSGRPLFLRKAAAKFTLANFMRMHIYSAMTVLRIGMDILTKEEQVSITSLFGQGGFFRTPEIGQKLMAAALNTPVSVMETAGEGGPWGMAILAAYMICRNNGEALADYLENKIFRGDRATTILPDSRDVAGFNAFLDEYKKGLIIEKMASEIF